RTLPISILGSTFFFPLCVLGVSVAYYFPSAFARHANLSGMPPDALYPPLEPFQTGRLQVDSIHTVYWEQCGQPDGCWKPTTGD
ncbi:MAG: hypothetical protein V3T83_13465, partial [Acidobacteriota bacterium]